MIQRQEVAGGGGVGRAAGCGINDKDLAVAAAAYHPATRRRPRRRSTICWPKAAKEQVYPQGVRGVLRPDEGANDLRGPRARRGGAGRARPTRRWRWSRRRPNCKTTITATWVKEDGRWRRLYFPEAVEEGRLTSTHPATTRRLSRPPKNGSHKTRSASMRYGSTHGRRHGSAGCSSRAATGRRMTWSGRPLR